MNLGDGAFVWEAQGQWDVENGWKPTWPVDSPRPQAGMQASALCTMADITVGTCLSYLLPQSRCVTNRSEPSGFKQASLAQECLWPRDSGWAVLVLARLRHMIWGLADSLLAWG